MPIDLSRFSVFSDLNESELAAVRGIFCERELAAGTVLIREDDTGEEMYVLVRGKVQVSKAMLLPGMKIPLLNMESPRKVLATLGDAAYPIFGEVALIDNDTRSATVLTVTDCSFLATDRTRFFTLIQSDPVLGVKLLLALSRRMATTVRRTNAEIVKLTTALALALRKEF